MKTHHRGVALLACAVLLLAASATAAQAAGRITGGTKVDRAGYDARWRPVVSLRSGVDGSEVLGKAGQESSLEGHFCGGTLVRPDIVVTAAHCVTGEAQMFRLVQGRTRVLVGARTLIDGPKQPGQLVDVAETRVHPGWRGSDSIFDESPDPRFDVAVLRLVRPVTGIAPMQMVDATEDASWGNGAGLAAGARVAGWGVTNALYDRVDIDEADAPQRGLREVELPLLPDRACESTDSAMGGDATDFDRASMICGYARDTDRRANRSNRRGACYGDSGGPLAVPAADGTLRLVGIVSWGPSTGGGCNRASVFARIAGVRDWVNQSIAEFGGPSPLAAAAPTGATQQGATSLRLEWPAAAGSPIRYTVLNDVPLSVFAGDELEEEFEPGELTPAGRAFLRRLRLLLPVGSGGSEARSLRVDGLEPRRPGQAKKLAFRIEVRDAEGRSSRSAPLRVDAPVDSRAPGMPRVRRGAPRGGAPLVTWGTVADNDCVRTYVVEVRRAGRTAWQRRATNRVPSCDSGYFHALLEEYGPRALERNAERLYRLAPGGWFVRVIAIDRAGNRTSSLPIRIRSRRSVPRPRAAQRCFTTPRGHVCEVTRTTGGPRPDDE